MALSGLGSLFLRVGFIELKQRAPSRRPQTSFAVPESLASVACAVNPLTDTGVRLL